MIFFISTEDKKKLKKISKQIGFRNFLSIDQKTFSGTI